MAVNPVSIHSLAHETLVEIVKLASPRDRTAMMQTSWIVLDAVAVIRYRSLTIRNDMKILVHILTSGHRIEMYCRRINTIVFRTTSVSFDMIAINTLVKLLVHTPRLRHLSFDVSAVSSEYAEATIQRYKLIRRPLSILKVIGRGTQHPAPPSQWVLPALQCMCIGKGLSTIHLLSFRHITTIFFIKPLNMSEIDSAMATFSAGLSGAVHLCNLGVAIEFNLPCRGIILAIMRAVPSIQYLSISQRRINLKVRCSLPSL